MTDIEAVGEIRMRDASHEIRDKIAGYQIGRSRTSNPESHVRYHPTRFEMNIALAFAAVSEAATGLALLAYPSIVVRLLLGAEIIGVADVISRFAGVALIGLGVACWPNGSARQALHGMLTYGTLAALYLAYIGVSGQAGGVLLWPAVAVHVILIILLLRPRSRESGK
jgi:hypothetical protein